MLTRPSRAFVLLSCLASMASVASADPPDSRYVLQNGKVRFVCDGTEVTVPAWGQFGTVEGALSVDPEDLSKASGQLEVYLVSIRTDDAAWDTMFRRAGFLEIDEHPNSRFVLEKVHGARRLQPGKWVPVTLEGRFTLHGITKKMKVPATVKWMPADAKQKQGARIRARASFHINWYEYQISMPPGRTRTFAGDGALIHADLDYVLSKPEARRGN